MSNLRLNMPLSETSSNDLREALGTRDEPSDIVLYLGSSQAGDGVPRFGLHVWAAEHPEEGMTLIHALSPSLVPAGDHMPAQGAVNVIAALRPLPENSTHGPRMRCRQCSYAWAPGETEAHGVSCAYVIATSVPHTAAVLVNPEAAPSEQIQRIMHLRAARADRIYIAGPMTDLPERNFPAFNARAAELRAAGWHVENPAEHGHVEGAAWADYLRWDISRIVTCGAIHLLPGWSKSKGATFEHEIAQTLGMQIHFGQGAERVPQPAAASAGGLVALAMECGGTVVPRLQLLAGTVVSMALGDLERFAARAPATETVPAGYKLVLVPDESAPDEPDWEECKRQAEVATGLKVEPHTFSIVKREVRRWLAHRWMTQGAASDAVAREIWRECHRFKSTTDGRTHADAHALASWVMAKVWKAEPTRPGPSFHVVAVGDTVLSGDEVIDDDCVSWVPVDRWSVGRPCLQSFKTIRRRASAETPQLAPDAKVGP